MDYGPSILVCNPLRCTVEYPRIDALNRATDGYTSRFLYTLYLILLFSFTPMMLYLISSVLDSGSPLVRSDRLVYITGDLDHRTSHALQQRSFEALVKDKNRIVSLLLIVQPSTQSMLHRYTRSSNQRYSQFTGR